MARIAMIGTTGLVGRSLGPLLVERGHQLLVVGRRPSRVAGAREAIGPLEQWPAVLADEALDVAISTLGTTWRKAGSWPAFEAVDRTAVAEFARAARRAGARQMVAVSSVGADRAARNPYLALKGRMEADLQSLGFERLDILRPGLLVGARGADRRLGERLGILLSPVVNPLLAGRLSRYRSIPAARVAEAIAALAGAAGGGARIHHNRDIAALG